MQIKRLNKRSETKLAGPTALLTGLLLALLLAGNRVQAQNDPIYVDGVHSISGPTAAFYGDLILGPNAELYLEDGLSIYLYGGNLIIDPAAKIYGADHTWTTFTEGMGTARFIFQQPNPNNNSTVQQTVNGGNTAGVGGNPSLMNIEIDNPAGVVLTGSNTRVTGDITFTSGSLLLGGQNLELGPSATLTGAGTAKHIVTNGAGYLVKEGLAASAGFLFPVGSGTGDYTPAYITNKGGAANDYYVQVMNYAASTPSENAPVGMDKAWHIYAATAATANVRLTHNTTTNGSNFSDQNAFVTQQRGPGIWMQGPPNNSSGNPVNDGVLGNVSVQSRDLMLATSASAYDSWISKSSDALRSLPVTLLSFTARPVNSQSLLEWVTGAESNSSHFTVQHSRNGTNWQNIGLVSAAGQSTVQLSYRFTHTNPVTGSNQYRLQLVDKDGQFTYSPIRELKFQSPGDLVLAPNPASSKVKLVLPSALSAQGRVQVYNSAGQLMLVEAAGGKQVVELEVAVLAQGVYQVVVTDQEKILYRKPLVKE